MKILVINRGSSPIKYRLFKVLENGDMKDTARGLVSNTAQENAEIVQQTAKGRYEKKLDRPDYRQGFSHLTGVGVEPGNKGV